MRTTHSLVTARALSTIRCIIFIILFFQFSISRFPFLKTKKPEFKRNKNEIEENRRNEDRDCGNLKGRHDPI